MQRFLPSQRAACGTHSGGRKPTVDPAEGPPAPGCLLLQHAGEHTPAGIVHGLRQPGAREPSHAQVLDKHRLALTDDPRGLFVRPIPTRIGHPGMRLGYLDPCFRSVLRPLFFAGHDSLRLAKLALHAPQETRVLDRLPVRQNCERRQPQINTDLGIHWWQRRCLHFNHERREIPPRRVLDDRDRRRIGRELPRPTHRDIADLRQAQLPPGSDRKASIAREPDRLPIVPAGPESRRGNLRPLTFPGRGLEEIAVRGVQIDQRLLQHDRRHLGQPRPFDGCLRCGEPLGQLSVADPPPSPICLLPGTQSVVVGHPSTPEGLRQGDPLA